MPAPAASEVVASTPLLSPGNVPGKYKTYLYQRFAHDKEACAVTHLFARKQRGGIIWLVTGAGAITWLASKSGTHETANGTTTVKVSPIGWGLLVGLFGGVGIGKVARFGNDRLYKLMQQHEQNFPFPYDVTKRLRDRDYERTGSTP